LRCWHEIILKPPTTIYSVEKEVRKMAMIIRVARVEAKVERRVGKVQDWTNGYQLVLVLEPAYCCS
jgi:hypothetical protein